MIWAFSFSFLLGLGQTASAQGKIEQTTPRKTKTSPSHSTSLRSTEELALILQAQYLKPKENNRPVSKPKNTLNLHFNGSNIIGAKIENQRSRHFWRIWSFRWSISRKLEKFRPNWPKPHRKPLFLTFEAGFFHIYEAYGIVDSLKPQTRSKKWNNHAKMRMQASWT